MSVSGNLLSMRASSSQVCRLAFSSNAISEPLGALGLSLPPAALCDLFSCISAQHQRFYCLAACSSSSYRIPCDFT